MGSIQKRTYAAGKAPRYVARVRVGGKEISKSFAKQGEAREWVREREGLSPTGKRMDNRMLSAVLKETIPHAATESTGQVDPICWRTWAISNTRSWLTLPPATSANGR